MKLQKPVIIADREGEQTGAVQYELVNRIPSSANLSML
ncbi:unnamed protein product, partial [marine sediment metagenome]